MALGISVFILAYAAPARRLLLPARSGVLTRPSDTVITMPRAPSSTPPPAFSILDTTELALPHVSFVTLSLANHVY